MPDESIIFAERFIMNACTSAKINAGVLHKHQRSIGVTFNATQEQWGKFYDLIVDQGYEVQGVSWKEVGRSKNQPLYFYDLTVKVF